MDQIFSEMTLEELFALHNKLADDIRGLRTTQGLISKIIRSKELAKQVSGPPNLTQSLTVRPNG